MKVSVGIPTYNGTVPVPLVSALLTETLIAEKSGIEIEWRFLSSCTNLALGRNQIVREFLKGSADKLVFIDADVTFQAGDLCRLAAYPVDLVAGCYRFKRDEEAYPAAFLEDVNELWADKNGLLEVAMVPTGFMALSRDVFAKFKEAYPNRSYGPTGEDYCYFQIPYAHGCLYTEDAYFCREWRDIGGKVYLAPEFTLTHWQGNVPYVGHIGKWLKNRSEVSA
jgi:glycosyltransferase involved in cell wall biosynthesis